MYGELGPPALNIDYLILLSLVLYFKTHHQYVLLTLKPKVPQGSETFCRRILTFLDPTYVQITVTICECG
jgi:hypothetical protein